MLETTAGILLILLILPTVLLSLIGLWEVADAVIAHKTQSREVFQCITS